MLVAAFGVVLALQVNVTVEIDVDGPAERERAVEVVELDSATLASAYLDPGARELVRRARQRREGVDRSIRAYRALARERVTIGINALRRERLLYRRESAARIDWRRHGPLRVEALGAREVIPLVIADPGIPTALESYLPHLAFDPAEPLVEFGFDEDDYFRHPLAAGAEADYRYATGDTTRIRLPDGREVQLIQLELHPRRADSRLLSGALWLEAESHAVVQAVYRLARPFDLERDLDATDPDAVSTVPRFLKPVRAEFRYLTVEYGFWEMRWWLPRLIAFDGYAEAGRALRVPIRYERTYSEYEVTGDTLRLSLPAPRFRLAGAEDLRRRCPRSRCRCEAGLCRSIQVELPADSAALLESEHLPATIFEEGARFVNESELDAILDRLMSLARGPVNVSPPSFDWPGNRAELVRYNRVEGLSVGAGVGTGYGPVSAELIARIGVSERAPRATLSIEHRSPRRELRFSTYRRLEPLDAVFDPRGFANSINALVLGRDDGDYFDAWGAELVGRPAPSRRPTYEWRLFAERHRPLDAHTDFSLLGLFSDRDVFRPAFPADSADLLGAALTLRAVRGLDPAGFRWGVETTVEAATGTFRYARPSTTLLLSGPVLGRWIGSLEAAAGTTLGHAPAQRQWYLGGPATLRGHTPLAARGESFGRARAEMATGIPLARIAFFSDIAWAGSTEDLTTGRPLLGAGAGVGLLDGLLRLDVARAMKGPERGWRVDAYVERGL